MKKTELRPIRRKALAFAVEIISPENQAEFARIAGKPSNQINDLINSDKRSFGEGVARAIESGAGLPPYWLDVDYPDVEAARRACLNWTNYQPGAAISARAAHANRTADTPPVAGVPFQERSAGRPPRWLFDEQYFYRIDDLTPMQQGAVQEAMVQKLIEIEERRHDEELQKMHAEGNLMSRLGQATSVVVFPEEPKQSGPDNPRKQTAA